MNPEIHHNEDAPADPELCYYDFDYSAVDGDQDPELVNLDWEQVDAALKLFRSVVGWMWNRGEPEPNGLLLRAVCICWAFVPSQRKMTLTEMAEHFGRDKQSLDRWHKEFKKEFPFLKLLHQQWSDGCKKRSKERRA